MVMSELLKFFQLEKEEPTILLDGLVIISMVFLLVFLDYSLSFLLLFLFFVIFAVQQRKDIHNVVTNLTIKDPTYLK